MVEESKSLEESQSAILGMDFCGLSTTETDGFGTAALETHGGCSALRKVYLLRTVSARSLWLCAHAEVRRAQENRFAQQCSAMRSYASLPGLGQDFCQRTAQAARPVCPTWRHGIERDVMENEGSLGLQCHDVCITLLGRLHVAHYR